MDKLYVDSSRLGDKNEYGQSFEGLSRWINHTAIPAVVSKKLPALKHKIYIWLLDLFDFCHFRIFEIKLSHRLNNNVPYESFYSVYRVPQGMIRHDMKIDTFLIMLKYITSSVIIIINTSKIATMDKLRNKKNK